MNHVLRRGAKLLACPQCQIPLATGVFVANPHPIAVCTTCDFYMVTCVCRTCALAMAHHLAKYQQEPPPPTAAATAAAEEQGQETEAIMTAALRTTTSPASLTASTGPAGLRSSATLVGPPPPPAWHALRSSGAMPRSPYVAVTGNES